MPSSWGNETREVGKAQISAVKKSQILLINHPLSEHIEGLCCVVCLFI